LIGVRTHAQCPDPAHIGERRAAVLYAGFRYTWVVRIYPDDMKLLPRPEKRAIMKAVQRGRRVDDPARAAMAVEYATNYARMCRWIAFTYSIIAAFDILLAVLDPRWFEVVMALVWLVSAPMWFYISFRTTRSVRLNQALMAGASRVIDR
jgi:hypothetical protein